MTPPQSHNDKRRVFWDTLVANYTVWPLLQVVNFKYVGVQHQTLFVNIMAIFWNAYLSSAISSESPDSQILLDI